VSDTGPQTSRRDFIRRIARVSAFVPPALVTLHPRPLAAQSTRLQNLINALQAAANNAQAAGNQVAANFYQNLANFFAAQLAAQGGISTGGAVGTVKPEDLVQQPGQSQPWQGPGGPPPWSAPPPTSTGG